MTNNPAPLPADKRQAALLVKQLMELPVRADSSALIKLDLWAVADFMQQALEDAEVRGRVQAVQCHALIESEWKNYKGSSSFLDVALQTIKEADLQPNTEGKDDE